MRLVVAADAEDVLARARQGRRYLDAGEGGEQAVRLGLCGFERLAGEAEGRVAAFHNRAQAIGQILAKKGLGRLHEIANALGVIECADFQGVADLIGEKFHVLVLFCCCGR